MGDQGPGIADLAERAGVSPRSIHACESATGIPERMNIATLQKLRDAFEAAGVEIIEPRTRSLVGGPGVRLKQ